jgi:hypothetical protein
MKAILLTSICITAAAACGGTASEEPPTGAVQSAIARAASGREALFAADALHTAQIQQLGPVDGVVRSLRGNVLYLAAGIDIVQGKQDARAALQAEDPDSSHTTLDRTVAGGRRTADGASSPTGAHPRRLPLPDRPSRKAPSARAAAGGVWMSFAAGPERRCGFSHGRRRAMTSWA